MDLSAKHVVVTGACGALGRAVCARAAALGASVTGLDVVSANVPGCAAVHAVDLGDGAATAVCLDRLAPVDALFNIAGGFAMGPTTWQESDAGWDAMFRINVDTLRNVLRAAVPGMIARGRGSIVNVGAIGALKGQPNMAAYTAAKSVVMRLTESLSAEVRENGVNVNAVLPSLIDTPRNRSDMPAAEHARWVDPADLANVICFLGSDAARAVHGALVPVSGLV